MKSMLRMLELRDYDECLLASKCCADKKTGSDKIHMGIGITVG